MEWRDAEVLEVPHTLDAAGVPAGTYSPYVWMVDYGTGPRLSAASPASTRPAADSLGLEGVAIALP